MHYTNKKMAARQQKKDLSSLTILNGHGTKASNTSQGTHKSLLSQNGLSPVVRKKRRHRITINVSGEKFQTYLETLEKFPKTLLGDATRREEYFEMDEDEYFFDRDRYAFAAIIYYYQSSGEMYCPLTVPLHILVAEVKFFDLGQDALNKILNMETKKEINLPKNKLQREIWKLFDVPESGTAANLMTIFSVVIIICSVIILCIETLPYFKGYETKINRNKLQCCPNVIRVQATAQSVLLVGANDSIAKSNPTKKTIIDEKSSHWREAFAVCETGIVTWFTLEFIVRLLSCPEKLAFVKDFMNVIDLLAILPYFITLAFRHQGLDLDRIRIIRLVRVFRIFKLSRHSRGLQILGMTLKSSIKELALLIFFLFIGVVLFSSAVYYVEEQSFQSIPDAFWWAIITMCTVGYGDMAPTTFLGKVIGGLCAISGVLTIALPVPVIVSNFDYFYQKEQARKFYCVMDDDAGDAPAQPSSSRSSSDIFNTEEFQRQEHIERRKQLKKLESRHHWQSVGICQKLFKGSGIGKFEQKYEQNIVVERESVV